VIVGLAGAAVLVLLAIGASRLAGLPLRVVPQTDFGWWALITVLVASAEELILRGVLFDALTESAGIALAVAVTSIVFALIHVPLYGWHVVPLDLGVGVFLGGLRLVSGSVAAPAIAHIGADLATWWL
jgi:membrane protease YdiL (CAAX protease family)